jgi:hypothetical protein
MALGPILALHGVPLVLQVMLPVALLAWLVRGGDGSITQWLIKTSIVLTYLTAAHFTGLWLVVPWYTALVFLVGAGAITLWRTRACRTLPWRSSRPSWRSISSRAALALFSVVLLTITVAGRQPPFETTVDLEFPLRDGVYYVVGGGSVQLLNSHLMTLAGERFRTFRGQSYGVDLVALGPFGMRASGLLPRDPTRYAIYGDRVFAPCSGVVVHAEDGAPDMSPPQPDRTRMPGNHVLLDCDGVHILLAHFRPGSVRVQRNQRVTTNTVVGLVGNSGNSNEPHLHIHAQRPARSASEPLSGDPLPMRFGGNYLVRNDRVVSRQPSAE